ncbi:MAG: SDR family oxidoreductase [Bacilli bacterium]
MKKVMVITGGSSGIGASLSKLAENYEIVLCYCNNKENAIKLKKENITLFKLDLTDEKNINELYNFVIEKYKRIDVLVNNAAIAIDTLFENKTKNNFIKTLETNLVGPFLLSKLFGQYMFNQKDGSIINITSTNGIDTFYPMSIDYDASKAGLISLTKNLACQFAPYVRVNDIAPGWVNTEMNKELDEEFIEQENKKILLGRFAEPEEIAKVILFLADSTYINGTTIRVDGGKN